MPPLPVDRLHPNERVLVDLVAAERLEGRRVLVHVTHTGTRDITGRMDDILTSHGFRVAVMKADAVAPDKKKVWEADSVEEGIDILICHPRLVPTGLDLVEFPTICWFETEFSVFQSAPNAALFVGREPATSPLKAPFAEDHIIEQSETGGATAGTCSSLGASRWEVQATQVVALPDVLDHLPGCRTSEPHCLGASRKSSRNSEPGATPVTRRWSRARVQAT